MCASYRDRMKTTRGEGKVATKWMGGKEIIKVKRKEKQHIWLSRQPGLNVQQPLPKQEGQLNIRLRLLTSKPTIHVKGSVDGATYWVNKEEVHN